VVVLNTTIYNIMTQEKVQKEYTINLKGVREEVEKVSYVNLETQKEEERSESVGYVETYIAAFDNRDKHKEIILPTAFNKSIKGITQLFALFQHNLPYDIESIDNIVGVHTNLEVDEYGLKSQMKIYLDNDKRKYLWKLIKDGVLNKMSIGMIVEEVSYDESQDTTYIIKATPIEGSVVLIPANDNATINIKSFEVKENFNEVPKELATKFDNQNKQDKMEVNINNNIEKNNMELNTVIKSFEDLKTIEKFLKEKLDISQTEAKTLISKIKFFGDIDLKSFVEEKLEEFKESMENTFNTKLAKLETKGGDQDNQPTDELKESVEVKSNQCDVDYNSICKFAQEQLADIFKIK